MDKQTAQRAEDSRVRYKHELEHLRRALLASRQEVAALKAQPEKAPIIVAVADPETLHRLEARLHQATQRAAAATKRANRAREALEAVRVLVQAREVDWAALLAAVQEGLKG